MAWFRRFKVLILIGSAAIAGCGPGPNVWRIDAAAPASQMGAAPP